jgi:hypothetical protein
VLSWAWPSEFFWGWSTHSGKTMKGLQLCLFTGIALIIASVVAPAMAQEGLPGSPEFGYGACLDLEGYHIDRSIQTAQNYGLDWITIEFAWGKYWDAPDSPPHWEVLDSAMGQIQATDLSVMLAITEAPDWALDANGPHIDSTISLISEIVRRYPNNLRAIELFSSANTTSGWGATPNPRAYAELINAVQFALKDQGFNHTVIAAGLDASSGSQSALQFLQELFAANRSIVYPVISLHLPSIAHSPETNPKDASSHTLRFYEDARQIMLDNGQQNGLLWITHFDWSSTEFNQSHDQVTWLQQAFLTMRSQLYIGMASYYCLNATTSSTNLIASNGDPSVVFNALGELIAAENSGISITQIIPIEGSGSNHESKPASP